MICASWLKQKTELRKLFVVPNTVRGRPGGSLQSRVSRGPHTLERGCSLHSRIARAFRVPDRLMVNYYIQHTPSSPLSLPHRGSYGLSYDDSVTWPVVVRGISYIMWYSTLGFFA